MSSLRRWVVGGGAGLLRSGLRLVGVGRGQRPAAPQRVLLLKPCCIGDLLFTTPLLAAISEFWPGAAVDYLVGPHSRAAVLGNPRLNEIVDAGLVGAGRYPWPAMLKLAGALRRRGYAAAFVPDRSPALALLALLARIPYRAGLNSSGRGLGLSVAAPVDDRQPRHEVERYLDVARAAGLPLPSQPRLEYYPGAQAMEQAAALLGELGLGSRPLITLNPAGGVNPGTVLKEKRWPLAAWRALLPRLAALADVLVIGGQADLALAAAVTAELPAHNVAGRLDLAATGALFQRAALHLGGDTGTSHLAVACTCRTVAIFGPTSVLQYGLYGPANLVRSLYPVGKQGGGGLTSDVPVAGVYAAARELLGDL